MKVTSKEFNEIERKIGAKFEYFCDIELIKVEGNYTYKPQLRYNNRKGYPYLNGINDETQFCSFKPNLPKMSGDYLWVVDDEIIYIGQAESLYKRFNTGYGSIQPRNCYKGGQSTNVKMNRVALDIILNQGKRISIYICETADYDRVERELLSSISTQYNVQNNS